MLPHSDTEAPVEVTSAMCDCIWLGDTFNIKELPSIVGGRLLHPEGRRDDVLSFDGAGR